MSFYVKARYKGATDLNTIDLQPGAECIVEVVETHFAGITVAPCGTGELRAIRGSERKYRSLDAVLGDWELLAVVTPEEAA